MLSSLGRGISEETVWNLKLRVSTLKNIKDFEGKVKISAINPWEPSVKDEVNHNGAWQAQNSRTV